MSQEKVWENTQKKTFTKWVNSHLVKRGEKIENLETDLDDGIRLIKLLEVIGAEDLGKFDKKPRMRIQKIQNLNVALNYIASKGVKLVGISSEEVCDGNLKLILGMIWTIILRFAISGISEEELSAKEALLLWCQKKTAPFAHCKVENFHTSWTSGMAFCALIAAHRPDLLDYSKLDPKDAAGNLEKAFSVAEKDLGIVRLLDLEDLVDVAKPDERSVMTYVAAYYHVFSAYRKQEVAGRRIGKLLDVTRTNEELMSDYNDRSKELSEWIDETTGNLNKRDFPNTLDGTQNQIQDFNNYKTNVKPPKAADKVALETLANTIAVKLKSAGQAPFQPAIGVDKIDNQWNDLEKAEQERLDALRAELQRQKDLDIKARRFNNKAGQLDEWMDVKEAYLKNQEPVESVEAANSALMLLDAFNDEYESSRPRLETAEGIAKELNDDNYEKKDETNARAAGLRNRWEALAPVRDAKKAELERQLADEDAKERKRKEFAGLSAEYKKWVNDTVTDVDGSVFGDSLETVEAYHAGLGAIDSDISATNDAKKAALDKQWDELQAAGVTSNRYTSLTNADVDNLHHRVVDSLGARRKAVDDELARQRELEEKRKEFAGKADAFVQHLDKRRGDIDALGGEPEPLIAAIRSEYADGKPEEAELNAIHTLQDEMGRLGITDNKHTVHSVPSLAAKNKALASHVRQAIGNLEEEDKLKKEYADRAGKLGNWAAGAAPAAPQFDNTLEGAHKVANAWRDYKTTDRAAQEVERNGVKGLYNKIADLLEARKRPAFNAEPSVDSIENAFTSLVAKEAEHEQLIDAEVARQEKLRALVRTFNAEADDLESWASDKEAFLTAPDDVTTLEDAQRKLVHLDVFDEELKNWNKRVADEKGLSGQIGELNYRDSDAIAARADALEKTGARFGELSAAKRAALNSNHADQQNKENLRHAYADKAGEYAKFAKQTAEAIGDTVFGHTLPAVTAYRDTLDADDARVSAANDDKKAAVDAAAAALQAAGVNDNRHTTLSPADVDAAHQSVVDAIGDRRARYTGEVDRLSNNDAKAKEWADAANAFVDSLGKKRDELSAIQGEPLERADAIKAAHNGGAESRAALDKVAADNQALQALGVFSNPHTEWTVPALEKKNEQHNKFVDNLLNSIEEERELKERGAAAEAAWAEKQDRENKSIDFAKQCGALNSQLATITDELTEPIDVDSPSAVEELIAKSENAGEALTAAEPEFNRLKGVSKELNAAGINADFTPTQTAWDGANAARDARKDALAIEHGRQLEQDTGCKDFADKANKLAAWIKDEQAKLKGTTGELEEQLATVRQLRSKFPEGQNLMDEVSLAGANLDGLGVLNNPHTEHSVPSLQSQVNELNQAQRAKESVLDKELLAKKHSQASPEQIDEFKEVFRHFDKDNKGSLNKLQFKSCLQSLGEDPSDDDIARLLRELGNGEKLEFDNFVEYMIKLSSDSNSKEQIISSFQDLCDGRPFVTEQELRVAMPGDKVDYLISVMPKNSEGNYDYRAWVNNTLQ